MSDDKHHPIVAAALEALGLDPESVRVPKFLIEDADLGKAEYAGTVEVPRARFFALGCERKDCEPETCTWPKCCRAEPIKVEMRVSIDPNWNCRILPPDPPVVAAARAVLDAFESNRVIEDEHERAAIEQLRAALAKHDADEQAAPAAPTEAPNF